MNENTNIDENNKEKPKNFGGFIYIIFFWCLIGISGIYGFRLWFDMPLHPSFLPLVGAVFAAILAFTLVMSLEYVVGPIVISQP